MRQRGKPGGDGAAVGRATGRRGLIRRMACICFKDGFAHRSSAIDDEAFQGKLTRWADWSHQSECGAGIANLPLMVEIG